MTSRSGSYTANLLGNIRSHLAGLQGYDVMALELIQNADDAKAESVVFDVTDAGLVVHNSGKFRYCGNLWDHCAFPEKVGQSCDFHRIVDVGSGGKLASSENIGRFGIGFVSTYQITDHPQITSSGLSLTLLPEKGEWRAEDVADSDGTTFILPWASDPTSLARKALGTSYVGAAHRRQLLDDFQRVLRNCLLFLKHLRTAELRHNGKLIFGCVLDRTEGSDLILSVRPSMAVERWHILRADATEDAKELYAQHPVLQDLKRSTTISIGLRVEPAPVRDGLLYAYLPTEQSSGLPLHINADFFPESDRKAVIFSGHQYQEDWNSMLIDVAARRLAADMEGLLNLLGHEQFWSLLNRALQLSTVTGGPPLCFKNYWGHLKQRGQGAMILRSRDGAVRNPTSVFQSKSPLNDAQAAVLHQIGCNIAAEELRPHFNAVGQMGSQILTLERLAGPLTAAVGGTQAGSTTVGADQMAAFYQPLWAVVEDLLPEATILVPTARNAVETLMAAPFLVTADHYVVTPKQSCVVPVGMDPKRIAELLPTFAICALSLRNYPKLHGRVSELSLREIADHLEGLLDEEAESDDYLSKDPAALRDFYTLLATLDRLTGGDAEACLRLKKLPIWPSSNGLVPATHALLPGDFKDPTGQAELLDPAIFTDTARAFVADKIGVAVQTIEVFVRTVVPRLFAESGPADESVCVPLLKELAKHTSLVNDEDVSRQLGWLPMVPTRDGGWSPAISTYRRSDALVKVLGDREDLWLDSVRIPDTRSVHNFLDSIGLRNTASAEHLVDRIIDLAQSHPPSDDIRRASGEAFYALCEKFERGRDQSFFQEQLSRLKDEECLPAVGDSQDWYAPQRLYTPFRSEAIQSQAKILDFRAAARLSTGLLLRLGVKTDFETRVVLEHLRHCVRADIVPNVLTYQVLSERAGKDPLVEELRNEPCIYVGGDRGFATPNRLYWSPQKLGRYASTIPDSLSPYRALFDVIGVKTGPDGADLADVLLEIVEANHERSTAVTGADHAIYQVCLVGISEATSKEELTAETLSSLREAPSVLNLDGRPTYPDEVLLQDSEWLADFFDGDLDAALCKPDPEVWDLCMDLGVRRLSEVAEVRSVGFEGEEQGEDGVADTLRERAALLDRALHDKPRSVRNSVRTQVEGIRAVSHEVVRVQATVKVGGNLAHSPPSEASAFFDAERGELVISRPIGARVWSKVLNALFHRLMPEESGIEISKLTLGVGPLLTLSVEEAHRALDDAGMPRLPEDELPPEVDTTSGFLGDIGVENENEKELVTECPDDKGDRPTDERATGESSTRGQLPPEDEDADRPGTPDEPELISPKPPTPPPSVGSGPSKGGGFPGPPRSDIKKMGNSSQAGNPPLRPSHKVRRDRRLLSYVRKDQSSGSGAGENQGASNYDHNLQVEAAARHAVCRYETERGRLPEQMAQTHPGHDIISHDPQTREIRLIEVKGIDGPWKDFGVGLSRTQFNMAQERAGQYWLYVVEHAFDPKLCTVLPIENPAGQVDSFMFDGNWRDVSVEESTDPARAFVAGVEVRHQHWKDGRILWVEIRGSERVMSIEFHQYGTKRITWNPFEIELLLEGGDDGAPDE